MNFVHGALAQRIFQPREGTVGHLPVPIEKLCYCIIHARMRIVEALLVRHAQALYDSNPTIPNKKVVIADTERQRRVLELEKLRVFRRIKIQPH